MLDDNVHAGIFMNSDSGGAAHSWGTFHDREAPNRGIPEHRPALEFVAAANS
jgi:hypothetical protein